MKKHLNLPPYFIIDSRILEDDRLCPFDKILYSVICGLSNNNKNYSYASNSYLANILNCSKSNVKRSLFILRKLGYLKIDILDFNKRTIRTTLNVIFEERNKRLEEIKNKPKKELIDYDWLNEGLYE